MNALAKSVNTSVGNLASFLLFHWTKVREEGFRISSLAVKGKTLDKKYVGRKTSCS